MDHPYRKAPRNALWKHAVERGFDPSALTAGQAPFLAPGEAVMSAGSCFAANIVPYLENAGIKYVWAERPHPQFEKVHKEALSYHKFSAAYGNLYTTRHLKQLFLRAMGRFKPVEDRWHEGDAVIDPYRPGLAFPASSDREFDLLTRQHLDCVLAATEQADLFVFTLGLTEGWMSRADGAVFPACPGTVRGEYDPAKHQFVNFGVNHVAGDLMDALALMREINPHLRVLLSVSPVPLVATATRGHVLPATIYSKSVLRVAADEVARRVADVRYFPAYEIVTGPQAPYEFFEDDRREPTRQAIDTVMGVFLGACGLQVAPPPVVKPAKAEPKMTVAELSEALAEYDCEEAAAAV